MSSGSQSRPVIRSGRVLLAIAAAMALTLGSSEFAAAQIHGIPPSVTSIQIHLPPFLPNIRPSVTSLGP